ncbi:MAG TPA: cellulase family glycosylhydrolase, partial [Patescibacteria group bacterium]|nr:cellulase family glycosylhydrolase [Patescibacteria group bacterium]
MNRAFLLMLAVVSLHTATAQNAKFEKWKTPSYFRGVNTTNINAKTQADFDFLKNTGANLVQIGTLGFQDVTPPYDYNPESAATTDSLVKFCRQSGLHYTIALRQGAGRRDVSWENSNGASTLWTNVEEQRLYASMVKSVTERYKGDSLFVGINAIMEPNPLYDGIYYAPELLQSALATAGIDMEALYAMFIDSVRAADTELPVIIQSVSYSSPE